jgi:hypothetical protein
MPKEMIAKLKARDKSERERTSLSRDANAGPNNVRKPRPDTSLI